MSNQSQQVTVRIATLERTFDVTNVIFQKYQPIFVELFKDPEVTNISNCPVKTKKLPCTPKTVFDFCWCLFIRVKAMSPGIANDLVSSYQLLLCCVDHIFACAFVADRRDLISEKLDNSKMKRGKDGQLPSVLDKLCEKFNGVASEISSIKDHFTFRIRSLFEAKILQGNPENLAGLLEASAFKPNMETIRKEYEAYVLSIGDYDERVFLGDDAVARIGTPAKTTPLGVGLKIKEDETSRKAIAKRSLAARFDSMSSLKPSTPLSAKQHLLKDEEEKRPKLTPVSWATKLVNRLNKLLCGRQPKPSESLKALINSNDSVDNISKRLKDIFNENYTESPQQNFFRKYDMATILYYKFLEAILLSQKTNNKPLNYLLDQDLFHSALITVCLEIVMFCYQSNKTFPWIIDTFNLQDVHFYKIIEVVIRHEPQLPIEVVKHLNRIEEQILESRAWTASSPFWIAIEKQPLGVPSQEEVALSPTPGAQSPSFPSNYGLGFFVQCTCFVCVQSSP